ncbi:MAG: hypothetical protein Q8P63_02695 [Candidatus Nealsonbacteria bacterium]|nr:hypothetical protein [Candidatus Nealsonbacteria bacterium]
MTYQHQNLAAGKWKKMSFFEQMANIGSEVHRAINWRQKKLEYSQMAADRALELLDLTITDEKNNKRGRLKEILRLREILVDYFYYDNIYKSNSRSLENYFFGFSYAAAINKN